LAMTLSVQSLTAANDNQANFFWTSADTFAGASA
jgi:hypothetical protein